VCVKHGEPETPEFGEMTQSHGAFTEEPRGEGIMPHGDPPPPVSTATTVRVRDGAVHATDGPFAETKKILGGLHILACRNLDEAIG
jgi:hypothetical protein